MPVAVRNVTKNHVIFSQPNVADSVEWGYSGIPDGSDLQEVPEDLWKSARMRRAVARGLLAEDTPENLDAAYARQRDTMQEKSAERQDEIAAALQAGAPGQTIVISAEQLDEHMKTVEARQPSQTLEEATQSATEFHAEQTARIAQNTDPMAVVNAAGTQE